MRETTKERYIEIQTRFAQMYAVERLRIDDCEQKLAKEFFLKVSTVRGIIKLDLTNGD